jgi:hypothetical protein
MDVAVVTTTIHVPTLLEAYMEDTQASGHRDVAFIVIGDRKTPPAARDFCDGLRRRFPFEVEYLGVEDQATYLASYPRLAAHLPYNSIARRNIGMLLAYERGAEVIVTIDDDNFLAESDFLGHHGLTGRTATLDAFGAPAGWLNVCDFLEEAHGFRYYHRGFPPGVRRQPEALRPVQSLERGRVVVNAGFWLGEPDIDAVTRLACPVESTRYTRTANFALARHTWSPFNSQNTALHRDVMPAYFLSPLVGRYDDIWASYVVNAIAHHLGDLITFGHPLVRQDRNPHDWWIDLEHEKQGMRLTDHLVRYLRAVRFTGTTYAACFREVVEALGRMVEADDSLNGWGRPYLKGFVEGLNVWQLTIANVDTTAAEAVKDAHA